MFHSLFPRVLEIYQPDYTGRDSTDLGVIRTLSRVDRIFINLLVAEARDFHCYSHVFENLESRTIPSDHAAVRLVIHKPTNREQQCKRIPSWMSKHSVICSLLKRLHDDYRYSADPCGALAEFKAVLEKAEKQTIRELSRKTPDSMGAKLLIASTALRAYRNRHLGTLMRCCEAWKPDEDCFDPISFECVDFQRLSQIIGNLTRENLAEREAEITNLPCTQTEKDIALARCRSGQRAWRNKKTCFVSVLSLMKKATHWKTKMNQVEGFVSLGDPFPKHVPKARDITSTKISHDMFTRLLTTSIGPLVGPNLKILHLVPM